MKSSVSVTHERRIAAAPEAVWTVIADPSMQERLEPRCRVETTVGDDGSVGSEFTLSIRGVRLRYTVVESDPEVRWVANVVRGEKHAGVQRGELTRLGPDTLLRWTVTIPTGPLLRRLSVRSCERELPRWLAAVEREVLAQIP